MSIEGSIGLHGSHLRREVIDTLAGSHLVESDSGEVASILKRLPDGCLPGLLIGKGENDLVVGVTVQMSWEEQQKVMDVLRTHAGKHSLHWSMVVEKGNNGVTPLEALKLRFPGVEWIYPKAAGPSPQSA